MKIPACLKCDRTGFILTPSGGREYCDCPAGRLSQGFDATSEGRRALSEADNREIRDSVRGAAGVLGGAEDTVRVLRILEYTGPRSVVEKTVSRSITGEVTHGSLTIRAATIGQYPEILTSDGGLKPEPELMPICGDPSRDDGAF